MKTLSPVMALVLAFSTCLINTGCSDAKFDSTVKTIENEIPAAVALGADLATLTNDAQLKPILATAGSIAGTDLPIIATSINAYFNDKTASTKAAVFAAVTTLTTGINAQVLAANKIVNAASQQAALLKLAAFAAVVNGMQLVLAPFFNSSRLIGPIGPQIPFSAVDASIPAAQQEKVAKAYGYTLEDLRAVESTGL